MSEKIKVEKRNITEEKLAKIRATNRIPATIYGSGIDPISISVGLNDFKSCYKISGESRVVELDIDGEMHKVIIRDVQTHPVDDKIQSVSFMKLDMDKEVRVAVPLKFIGVSQAVKTNIGFLVTPINEIPVRCLPDMIPSEYVISIDTLNEVGDSVIVKDIDLGKGVNLEPGFDSYVTIATVVPPQKVVETQAAATATAEVPEGSAVEAEKKA
jgi:large subunit ribosomal protein L25